MNFKNVLNFKYLGFAINNMTEEVNKIIINRDKAYFVNLKLLKTDIIIMIIIIKYGAC